MSARANTKTGIGYGGQAVIEGVMMRGKHKVAVAVRNPKGEIVVYEDSLNPAIYRGLLAELPFARGMIMIWDALGIGVRALIWSAEVAARSEKAPSRATDGDGHTRDSVCASAAHMYG